MQASLDLDIPRYNYRYPLWQEPKLWTIYPRLCKNELRNAEIMPGGMAERTNARFLKSREVQASVGSNPTPSADTRSLFYF